MMRKGAFTDPDGADHVTLEPPAGGWSDDDAFPTVELTDSQQDETPEGNYIYIHTYIHTYVSHEPKFK